MPPSTRAIRVDEARVSTSRRNVRGHLHQILLERATRVKPGVFKVSTRLREIDISRQSRASRILTWANYLLFFAVAEGLVNLLLFPFFDEEARQAEHGLELAVLWGMFLLVAPAFAFIAFSIWRCTGNIDFAAMRRYIYTLPLLFFLIFVSIIITSFPGSG